MINNLALVQARMSSTRFPGKVIKEINGVPLIVFLLKRVLYSKKIDEVVLVISDEKSDDQLFNIANQYGFNVYRGSLNNVLERFYKCSIKYRSENIIRITGDCPLIDPFLIDELIIEFEKGNWDYLSNCADENNLSVPDGFDTEIFKSKYLETAYKKAFMNHEREHVTPWFRSNKSNLKWSHFIHNPIRKYFRVTVDHPEDFIVIKSIVDALHNPKKLFTVDDVVDFLSSNSAIARINSHFVRNEGYVKSLKQDKVYKNN